MIKHIKRNTDASGALRKAQSVFLRGVVYPAIEEARQAFKSVERVPYMPEIIEADIDWSIDEDYAGMWEGRRNDPRSALVSDSRGIHPYTGHWRPSSGKILV